MQCTSASSLISATLHLSFCLLSYAGAPLPSHTPPPSAALPPPLIPAILSHLILNGHAARRQEGRRQSCTPLQLYPPLHTCLQLLTIDLSFSSISIFQPVLHTHPRLIPSLHLSSSLIFSLSSIRHLPSSIWFELLTSFNFSFPDTNVKFPFFLLLSVFYPHVFLLCFVSKLMRLARPPT